MNIKSTFTQNGSRLLSKTLNQVVNKEKGSCLENLENISSKAKTFDYVTLERKFGQDFVQIFSFRDASGKIVQRIQKSSGNKNILKVSNYSHSGVPSDKTQKVEHKILENGKIIKESFDNIFTSVRGFFKNKFFMSKTSFSRNIVDDKVIKSEETSLYGVFQNRIAPKKIIAKAQRLEDNSIKLKGIQYSGITKDEAKELAKDPYITMRLLPTSDFISTVRHKVYKDHDLQKANIRTFKGSIASPEGTVALAQARKNKDGSILMVLNKNEEWLKPKPQLIDSFNHEARHCRQIIYVEQLEHMKNMPQYSPNYNVKIRQMNYGLIDNKDKIKYAEKLKSAFDNYVSPEKDISAYKNNFAEVDARLAGKKAKDEYTSFADKLESIIPLTNEQLGL